MLWIQKLKRSFISLIDTDYEITPAYHVVFWLLYFSFNVLRWGSYYDDYVFSLKGNLLGFPIHMTLCYLTVYVLIPRFIEKKRYGLFALMLILSIFILVTIKYHLTYILISQNVWPEGPEETSSLTFNYLLVMMLGEVYVISFVTAIKITIDYMRETKRAARIEQARLETELKFLRSQISPHFFFNTLNNIYALSLEKSSKTPETILKLSDLLRYLLYETKQKRQSLKKEIKFINNYLDLERIRYSNALKLNFDVKGNPKGKKIAPMLLIHFIENAFKHGANKNIGHVAININLVIEKNYLYFKVTNTLPCDMFTQKNLIPETGGIGLQNVERRLRLGYAPDAYNLNIYEEAGEYVVSLKLKLV